MPAFAWEGRTRGGEVRKGVMEVDTEVDVQSRLRQMGISVTKVRNRSRDLKLPAFLQPSVNQRELVVFTRQLATMQDAGLPITQSLDILGNQAETKLFGKILLDVKSGVESGKSLSEAMHRHPRTFDDLFVNLVAAGEAGGILDRILSRLAAYMEKAQALKRQVKGAMVYPLAILIVAFIVVFVLLWKVVPVFQAMFKDFGGGALPAPTQFVINISEGLQSHFFLIVFLVVGSVMGVSYLLRTPQGTRAFDTVILKTPVFGPVFRKVAVARFTRTLGTLISSGVPLLDALDIVSRTAGNVVVADAINYTRQRISEGKNISEPLLETKVFPTMVVQMIGVGEQTGALDAMLQKIADFYEEEVDVAVSALTKLMEPMMMVFLGGIVGGLLIAMYAPIFEMAGNIKAGLMPAVASAIGRVPGPETKASRVEEPAAMRADRARRLTWIMLLRVVVTTVLLGGNVISDVVGASSMTLSATFVFGMIALTYGLTVLWAVLLRQGYSPARLATAQIACDVTATALLLHADGGADSGFVLLLLLAVIGGSLTLSRRGTAVTVVAVAVSYLGVSIGDRLGALPWWPSMWPPQTGPLTGIATVLTKNLILIIATGLLSRRLADELETAGQRIAAQGARLKRLVTLHADVVRSLSSGLLTIGADGAVLSLNPVGVEILGRSLPIGVALSQSLPDLSQLLDGSPLDGARRRAEVTVTLPDGQQRVLGCSVSPLIDAGGGAVGRVVNFQDLTELRRMQESVERTERLAAIGRLAAGIAHEIRNPLAAISGSIELLRSSISLDSEGNELMDIVTREADRLNRLITDLLDFARPRAPEKSALDVGATLGEILRVVENDRRLNPFSNRFHLDLPEALHVEADPGQLRQVVLNLLLNAADATPGGEPINLRAVADGEQVTIEVQDHGPGIPLEVRARLFEPFFTTKKGGTGLGLATVHRIIEEHRGSIEIADASGGGTVFRVRLPRATAAPGPA